MIFSAHTNGNAVFAPRTPRSRKVFAGGTRVRFSCGLRFRVPEGDEDITPSVVAKGTTGTVLSTFPMFVVKLDTDGAQQELKWHPGLQVQKDLEIITSKPKLTIVK